jgi:integrase
MHVMREREIGLREVRALKGDQTIWDAGLSGVAGFGARRQKGAAVSYILMYRTTTGRQRLYTIGRHGSPWTPQEARDKARELLVEVKRGGDPAADKRAQRQAKTVSELCDLYLADVEAGRLLTRNKTPKKQSTLAMDRDRVRAHIKPLLGRLRVSAVMRDDVEALMHDIAGGKGLEGPRAKGGRTAATRTVGLLGAIFEYGIGKRMRPDNPCRGVVKFRDGKRNRRLSDEEYAALADGLERARGVVWPRIIEAVRFLVVTGWRPGEVTKLRWSEVDLARRMAIIDDSKTGRSMRPLSKLACELLRDLNRSGLMVFPAVGGDVSMGKLSEMKGWQEIITLAKLPDDVTPHVLRHSFASLAGDLGYSDPTVAALIGHVGRTMTSRYQHAADPVLLAAADAVAGHTAMLMVGGNVVSLETKRA